MEKQRFMLKRILCLPQREALQPTRRRVPEKVDLTDAPEVGQLLGFFRGVDLPRFPTLARYEPICPACGKIHLSLTLFCVWKSLLARRLFLISCHSLDCRHQQTFAPFPLGNSRDMAYKPGRRLQQFALSLPPWPNNPHR